MAGNEAFAIKKLSNSLYELETFAPDARVLIQVLGTFWGIPTPEECYWPWYLQKVTISKLLQFKWHRELWSRAVRPASQLSTLPNLSMHAIYGP